MLATPSTLLVVDDEVRLRELLHGYLTQAGFVVLQAGDGLEALRIARADQPDLLVLDLNLPGMDGLDVCRQLRTFSDAYVLMLTARAEEIDRVIGLEVGADDYLAKPFSPRELVARVRAMLRRPRGDAGRATPPGGRVMVRARADGSIITVEVVDSGIGIAREHLPHLFERFYRVDKARSRALGGHGIGLTISKALVEAHGRRMWAHSDGLGTGASFGFTLPGRRP